MRAKLVENIEFKRGQDPKQSLEIGDTQKIKKMLEDLYNRRKYDFRTYDFISPDFIIIRYTPKLVKQIISGERNRKQERENLPVWIIKFERRPKYSNKSYDYDEKLMGWKEVYRKNEAVYEGRFINTDSPENMGWEDEILSKIYLGEYAAKGKREEAAAKCKVMADALNEHFPAAEGFLLIDEGNIPATEYEARIKEIKNKGSI